MDKFIEEEELLYLKGKYTEFHLFPYENKKLKYNCKICNSSNITSYEKIKDNLGDGCKNEEKHDDYYSINDITNILLETNFEIYNNTQNYFHKIKDYINLKCKICKSHLAPIKISKMPKNNLIMCTVCIKNNKNPGNNNNY